jgi:2-polyprenyl-3-methyl-5-hydroxy-6-metoxy-1,4-benzoquinol methylase
LSKEYFGIARREILPHLPAKVERMLELGCGNGATAALVKSQRKVVWSGGVEVVPDAAEKAKSVCDQVWQGDVERMDIEKSIPPGSLDLILCLDVLEHLVDPWTVVKRITPLLAPDGRLIASIPNIRHYKFIRDLLFRGKFRYADAGLLDRTHLRFFVRDTAIELIEAGGLKVSGAVNAQPWPSGDFRSILSQASFGGLDGLMVKQWLVVAGRHS